MTAINTTIKMTSQEALDYLDFIQDQIRVDYPSLSINIYVTIPFIPYRLELHAEHTGNRQITVLHASDGESFQNRIYQLKYWWENNQAQLNIFKRK